MKRATFRILTRGGPEDRTGYVLGCFATHKEPGNYFWAFTHLPTGLAVNVYPCKANKVEALAHLVHLREHGLPEHQQIAITRSIASGITL